VWTEEQEREFMAMVKRRRKLGIPFNPFGPGHEPPTDAEIAASLPMSCRLKWAWAKGVPENEEEGDEE